MYSSVETRFTIFDWSVSIMILFLLATNIKKEYFAFFYIRNPNMSRVMRKPVFANTKTKTQISGNREADQRLCFRYIYNTISLLHKYETSSI